MTASGTASVGTVSVSVAPNATDFGKKLSDDVKSQTSGIGGDLGNTIMGGLKAMAAPLAALAVGLSVKGVIDDSIKAFDDLGTSVRGMQRIAGGSMEQVSGLRGAMQLAGVNADDTTAAFTRFQKQLGETSGDAKATAEMAQKLGVSFTDASGAIKPMSEILPGLADKFKEMPNGAEKTALATDLFGRSGAQLIPILNKGSDGMAELTQKAKDMGLVLDDQSMGALADSKKAQREWDATLQGLQVTMGQVLMPIMEAFSRVVREQISPFIKQASQYIKDHRGEFEALAERIKSGVQPVIEIIVGVFRDFLIPVIMGAMDAIGWLSNNINVAIPILIVLGGILLAALVPAIVATTMSVWAFTAALLANPVTWIILGIVALIAVIVLLAMNWDNIVHWIGDVWNGFIGWITPSVHAIGDAFSNVFNGISSVVQGVFNAVVDFIKGYINNIIDIVNGAIDGLNGLGNIIRDVTGGAVDITLNHVPHLAEGGIVPATPGGRLVKVAEAGEAEAVIPLSKLGTMGGNGGGQTVNYYAAPNQSIDSQQALFDGMRRAKLLAGW
jgi:hypothetical protein